MNDVVIRAENIGKKYTIGHQAENGSYVALRDVLMHNARTLWNKTKDLATGKAIIQGDTLEEVWALKDVSFEIKRGEAVGIIGRNGAGKSTLLKILSRITEPSEGRVTIKGRVASLLEVGTGFHPELTGRENIYLNGTILGMTRAEIKRKFDEIVAFAEIEKFLDTPVKRYSSGMYVRLAFAVAAHLEPEILMVDEVLAVGDAAFQKKCLGKMGDVAHEGRTVLFISHNMGAISTLTQSCLFLDRGRLMIHGNTAEVVSAYIYSAFKGGSVWVAASKNNEPIQILRIELQDALGRPKSEFDVQESLSIEVHFEVRTSVRGAVVAVNIHAADGTHLISLEDVDQNKELLVSRQPGLYSAVVTLPGAWLNRGSYLARVGCGIPGYASYDNIEALIFTLLETGDPTTRGHRGGYLLPMLKWRIDPIQT